MNARTNTQQIAVEFLRKIGMEILDQKIYGFQIVAYDRVPDCIIFVTVTRGSGRVSGTPAAHSQDRAMTRKAIRHWLRVNRWSGLWRFDVVHVCGDGERPEIDHIENVKL